MEQSQKIKQLLDKNGLNAKVKGSIKEKLEIIKNNKTINK